MKCTVEAQPRKKPLFESPTINRPSRLLCECQQWRGKGINSTSPSATRTRQVSLPQTHQTCLPSASHHSCVTHLGSRRIGRGLPPRRMVHSRLVIGMVSPVIGSA
jgi:hypothetical protein